MATRHRPSAIDLRLGDCLAGMRQLADGSVDLIVTDPPYPRAFVHLYEATAREAARVLRVGGSFVTLCGHYQLPEVLTGVGRHLRYRWIATLNQAQGKYLAMGVATHWKPLLWYVKERLTPRRCIVDRCMSRGRCKSSGHPWEQAPDYAEWAIKSLTDPGDVVLDPFTGSGTAAIACLELGRRFVGFEIDPKYHAMAQARIAAAIARTAKGA